MLILIGMALIFIVIVMCAIWRVVNLLSDTVLELMMQDAAIVAKLKHLECDITEMVEKEK